MISKDGSKPLFEQQLEGYAICYHKTKVATPRQNGKVERQHRIKEKICWGFVIYLKKAKEFCVWSLETPTLIRYGQLIYNEYFVSQSAAQSGIGIENKFDPEPIVMLKHFAGNPADEN